ncbi:MAG: PHB depolymerase family esterase [Gemmatimonadales bacterium]
MPRSPSHPAASRASRIAVGLVLLGLVGTATPAGRLLPGAVRWVAPTLWAIGFLGTVVFGVWRLFRPGRGRLRGLAALVVAVGSLPAAAWLSGMLVGERHAVGVDGVRRRYHVDLPGGEAARPWPVVLALHGFGQSWWGMREITRLDRVARAGQALVAYPEGHLRSWNDGDDLKPATRAGVDDLGFLRALIRDLERRYPVDPDRVYAVGFSNGGFLLVRYACGLADELAAIGVVAAGVYPIWAEACRGQPLPPAAFVLGERDPMLRPLERFEVSPRASERLWRPLASGGASAVALWSLAGHGHGWPGGPQFLPSLLVGPIRQDWRATDSLTAFLWRHRRHAAKESP